MITKELGRTGTCISEVGVGTWDYRAGPEPLRKALEAGALFVDTAESYGTEQIVREAIRGLRQRVFLATKISPQNFSSADVLRSTENSLRNLGTDVIDLLQLHEPNPKIPIEETMGAMARMVDAGKVRFVGVSNFSVAQLQKARTALSKHPVVSNQVRYNLIDRTVENGLLQYCQANRVTVISYSPLARGLDRIGDCDPEGIINEVSRMTGKTPAQIAINWCLCHDGVVAIPKGNSIAHISENCGSSDWRLSTEHLRLLNEKIRYRHRNALDRLLRRYMPDSVRTIALRSVKSLPPGLRRRVL